MFIKSSDMLPLLIWKHMTTGFYDMQVDISRAEIISLNLSGGIVFGRNKGMAIGTKKFILDHQPVRTRRVA